MGEQVVRGQMGTKVIILKLPHQPSPWEVPAPSPSCSNCTAVGGTAEASEPRDMSCPPSCDLQQAARMRARTLRLTADWQLFTGQHSPP